MKGDKYGNFIIFEPACVHREGIKRIKVIIAFIIIGTFRVCNRASKKQGFARIQSCVLGRL